MKAKEIYTVISRKIIEGIWKHDDQMIAISKWVESEFEPRKKGQELPIDSVRLSCFKEVFEKFQEIEHESEFYGWLYAKAHEA